MIPRVKLLASFICLCSEGFIFPTSGSHTVTSSFAPIGDGKKTFGPDSYMDKTSYNRKGGSMDKVHSVRNISNCHDKLISTQYTNKIPCMR